MSKPMKMNEPEKIKSNNIILVSTGLIAISLIILQDYISTGVSDTPVLISLIAFSIALPLLAGAIMLHKLHISDEYYTDLSPTIPFWVGALCAFIGIDAALWHASWIAGVLFFVVSIISYIFYSPALPNTKEVERLQREEAEREKALE
jgi:hypothetical protein